MMRKILGGLAALVLASGAYAATDYPSNYQKCVSEGKTCSMSGTRSVAFGKAGSFVYATLTGSFTCQASLFPSSSVSGTRWCSYAKTAAASSSSASNSSASSSKPASSSSSSAPTSSGGSSKCVAGATLSNETVDCGGKTIGLSCKGDSETQPPVLTLNNATVKNVRLSKSGGSDGIHCTGGTCTLENVVWEDICEDAASIGNSMRGVTMVIKGGSAFNSTASTSPGGKPDKIFQNNGRNTTIDVQNFTALGEHGKLARSCGDCTDNGGPRYFKFNNVTVNAKVGSIVGVNRNYGDKATIRNMKIKDYKEGSTAVCEEYKGVQKGSGSSTKFKPASGSSWWNTANCDVSKSDVSGL
jgi:hypothetical protein